MIVSFVYTLVIMKTIVHVKTDKRIKDDAQKLASELGLSLSDVVNASLRNFLKSREVTFSAVPQMTAELEELIGQVENDVKLGENLSPAFGSAEEMDNYLESI